jgi:peptidoglycan/xylan/chitin deacetylase (PgdA/CDA1 family)
VHVDRVASVYFMQPLLMSRLVRRRPGIPILMYHSVSHDTDTAAHPYFRLVTTPAKFRDQMAWLHERGFQVIGLTRALDILAQGVEAESRWVVLTFDDGLQDFLLNAWPILAHYRFTASMFLPTGHIGNSRRSFKGRPCLTWNEVRELHQYGISFGAHTVSHPVLHRLPWREVAREITVSRSQIEQELQEDVTTFAYPSAFPQEDRRFTSRLRAELQDNGFHGAVTTVIGRAQPGHDLFSLRRLPVNDCDDLNFFSCKLAGAYDWLRTAQYLSRAARQLTK